MQMILLFKFNLYDIKLNYYDTLDIWSRRNIRQNLISTKKFKEIRFLRKFQRNVIFKIWFRWNFVFIQIFDKISF